MADYGVNIKFKVVGESGLDRVTKKAQELAKSVDNIRGIDIMNPRNIGGKGGKAARSTITKYRKDMEKLVDTVNKSKGVFGETANQQMAAADSLEQYVNQLKIGTPAHQKATQALNTQTKGMNTNTVATNKNTKAKKQNQKQNTKYAMGNPGNVASSAIIGGAFPLLFGQTGAAAVGGATGGAVGGMIGGQFGFALSILGTAVGQYIDTQERLEKSLTKVNSLFISMGDKAQFSMKEVKELAKQLRVTNEEAVAMLDMNKRFGKEGSLMFAEFFGDDLNKRMGQIDAIAQIQNQATAMKAIQSMSKDISIEEEFRLINMARQEGSLAVQIELQRILLKIQHESNLAQAQTLSFGDELSINMGKGLVEILKGLTGYELGYKNVSEVIKDNIDEVIRKYEEFDAALAENLQKVKDLAATYGDAREYIVPEIEAITKKLGVMMDAQTQVVRVSREIKDSFADSFKDVIKGTMTVTDAFRSMLNRIADYFLDTAAQLAAMQLQKGFLGLLGNMFPSLKTADKTVVDGTKAAGGPVRGGGTYLVGERGPELFSPGVSGMITPNHALGGGTNVVVNVDASGSSVEGDEERGRELGRLISVAVQSELVQQKRPGGLLA